MDKLLYLQNGDNVEADVYSIQLAMEFRRKFNHDVFIDLLCYRKYGHNKGDEPRFTQPILYKIIEKHPNPRDLYINKLVNQKIISIDQANTIEKDFNEHLERSLSESKKIEKAYRVSRKDISNYIAEKKEGKPTISLSSWGGSRDMKKERMSTLRIKLSQRLVAVKNQTAMLTTFNEVDMSAILAIRKQYKDAFKEKFDVSLGFMSFFTKAITEAIYLFPQINSMIDGEKILIPDYADIGIAVSGPKGLVVPVIRNAEILSLAEIEQKIKELAEKARANRITLEEMTQ